MSKPIKISVSFSIGYFDNDRVEDLREILSESIKRTFTIDEICPLFFLILLAHAGKNQTDGDFSDLANPGARLAKVLARAGVKLSETDAKIVWNAWTETGFIDAGGKPKPKKNGAKIHSFATFNRHLAEHEKIVKAKRKAQKEATKAYLERKREEAKAKANAPTEPTVVPRAVAKKPAQESVADMTRRVMAKKELLKNHPGRPEASNSANDPIERKVQQAEYRCLKREVEDLNKSISAGGHQEAA